MKINLLKVSALLMVGLVSYSCTTTQKSEGKDEGSATEIETQSEIILTKAPSSPQFPEANLTKRDLIIEEVDSLFTLDYKFDVSNYELGVQTEDAATRGIANSDKGQHIHYIVNNGPYAAHYMTNVPDQLQAGNYVVLAFLSRSYHESVKSANAFFIENITIGIENKTVENVEVEETDLTAPHLFYSRPKGTYKGNDAKKVMLDFYLLNTTLSPDGNKVKATINGKEFMIEEWIPYYIEGMSMGENTIKLELLDADKNLIAGPFNSVERQVILSAE